MMVRRNRVLLPAAFVCWPRPQERNVHDFAGFGGAWGL